MWLQKNHLRNEKEWKLKSSHVIVEPPPRSDSKLRLLYIHVLFFPSDILSPKNETHEDILLRDLGVHMLQCLCLILALDPDSYFHNAAPLRQQWWLKHLGSPHHVADLHRVHSLCFAALFHPLNVFSGEWADGSLLYFSVS